MRTKTLLLSAAVGAAGLLAANAQVYSVNSVGYVNLTIPPGFSMVANQLNSSDNTVGSLLPSVPLGTTVYKWNTATGQYDINNFSFAGWGNPAMTLNPGEGAFVSNTSGSNINITLVGEVPQGAASNINIPAGFSIVSSPVPQSAALDAIGFPAALGDAFYLFNNSSGQYEVYNFSFAGFGGNPPVPAVGQAFWVNKVNAAAWNRNFSVNN
jgi:hypothetical protein